METQYHQDFTQTLNTSTDLGHAQTAQPNGQVSGVTGSQYQVCSDVSNTSWIKNLFDQMRHLTGMVHFVQQRMQCVENIDSKLTGIDNKLTALDTSIKETILRVDRLEACVKNATVKCKEVTLDNQNLNQKLMDFDVDRDRFSRDIDDMFYDIDSIYQGQRDMKEEMLDLKTRSMRDNLLSWLSGNARGRSEGSDQILC